ncbi:GNAT family N-acetyltransferase [Kineosporia succinea]|uniref:GNAT superfamily N-acetyltransferase n=1 Tax=Kineosporia succinea TaxID=84632 RepID=A0ABT9NXY3_9ACTN|nr:GNAT family N-acetyltransferase [Kineosporia succinea]MDP9825288.1 GNAT superfamily N-acetyltransferase [Kineosporia succinea]
MNTAAVLAAFDEQLRRAGEGEGAENPEPGREPARVLNTVRPEWAAVTWSRLTETDADEVIAAQIERMAGLGVEWEWKYYSYDTPADLPARLRAAGLNQEPPESLMVADLGELDLVGPPEGVRIEPVTDAAGVSRMVAVHDEVFGGSHQAWGDALLRQIADPDPEIAAGVAAFVVMDGDRPISTGRVNFHPGTDFASIWGGSTVPGWRRRGVFRALVSHRARQAIDRGYRYLRVDAVDMSRPILQRMGFHEIATTTPFIRPLPETP